MDDCCSAKGCELESLATDHRLRRVLIAVLVINALMFLTEFSAGVIAGSAALMADAVDMLGDAFVYGLSLYALSRGAKWKAAAAMTKGGLILLFGVGVMIEVAVKATTGVPPSSALMLTFGAVALAANLTCLGLLRRYRLRDVNMSSTFECSRNDVIANLGVLIAAAGVAWFNAPLPDLIVGLLIAVVFLRSAARILQQGVREYRTSDVPPPLATTFTISPRRRSPAVDPA